MREGKIYEWIFIPLVSFALFVLLILVSLELYIKFKTFQNEYTEYHCPSPPPKTLNELLPSPDHWLEHARQIH